MTSHDVESVARALVADGKGILAADETIPTLTRRFDTLGIQSKEQSRRQTSVEEVATATLRCLRRHVPAAVPGIVFLSGGQSARLATAHLNAINRLPDLKPWKISFSYGRALQDPALQAWHGREQNLAAGQGALSRRARCNGAASLGNYTDEMEAASQSDDPPHRKDWSDD
jgi:fructose-bisphosphate aldolase class 1